VILIFSITFPIDVYTAGNHIVSLRVLMTNTWFHKISNLDSAYAKTGERHRKYQPSSQYHHPLTGIAVADLAE